MPVLALGFSRSFRSRPLSLRSNSPSKSGWHDLRGKVEEVAEEGDSFVRAEVPIIVSPVVGFRHVSAGPQGLHRLDDLEVGYALELWVLGSVEILLGYHNTLLEEVLVDRHPVLLRYQHLWAFNQSKTWQDVFARLTKSVEECMKPPVTDLRSRFPF